ncbi:nucleoside 2-deoxyribosyltransferase [Vibrio parahaemolyticus]|nr:nucleoside 2-deoxyribosyltransferase [Vibrio parahaemolyticus]
MRKKLYLASPLFCESELKYNTYLSGMLSDYFDVFLPQEDNGLAFNKIETGYAVETVLRDIFEGDIKAIERCDVLLIVLDGRSIDEGACFELGYAYSKGKLCVGLKTDTRQLMRYGNNPMITQALSSIFTSVDELENWASEFK